MAERRMFSKRHMSSAKVIKLPVSSRDYYTYLNLFADDDGIVEAYNVMKITGATEDDLRVLVMKGLVVVLNEDLVAYIVDWREQNKLRADRKIDSIYKDLLLKVVPEAKLLESKERSDRKSKCNEKEIIVTNDENAINTKNVEISTFISGTSQGQPMDSIGQVRLGQVSDRLIDTSLIYLLISDEFLKNINLVQDETSDYNKIFIDKGVYLNRQAINESYLSNKEILRLKFSQKAIKFFCDYNEAYILEKLDNYIIDSVLASIGKTDANKVKDPFRYFIASIENKIINNANQEINGGI